MQLSGKMASQSGSGVLTPVRPQEGSSKNIAAQCSLVKLENTNGSNQELETAAAIYRPTHATMKSQRQAPNGWTGDMRPVLCELARALHGQQDWLEEVCE